MPPHLRLGFARDSTRSARGVAFLLALLVVGELAGASAQILDVSSFRECVEFTDSEGNTLNCEDGVATVVRMRLPTSTEGDIETRSFSARLTVVPNENSDDVQTGSGTDCPSPSSDTCLPTVPADFTLSAGPGVLAWRLELEEELLENGRSPYAHYSNIRTTVRNTNDCLFSLCDVTVPSLLAATNPACTPVSVVVSDAAGVPFSQNTDSSLKDIFASDSSNFDHIRCDNTYGRAPRSTGGASDIPRGMLTKTYSCVHACTDPLYDSGDICETVVDITASFVQAGPICPVYRIVNGPIVAAPLDLTVSVAPTTEGGSPTVDTLTVNTLAGNQVGSSGVTTPNGVAAMQIIGIDTPNLRIGPYISGYITVCSSKPVGEFDMSAGLAGLFVNPLANRPTDPSATCVLEDDDEQAYYDDVDIQPYPVESGGPTPCSLAHLTGGDPFAGFFFSNTSQMLTVGELCGQRAVAPDIMRHLPRQASQVQVGSPAVALSSISSLEDGGTGEYAEDVFCIPRFGVGAGGAEVKMACNAFAEMREAEVTAPGRRLFPNMPHFYDAVKRDMWVGKDQGSGSLYLVWEQSERPFELDVIVTLPGASVAYEEPVTNGDFDPSAMGCQLGVGRVGTAVYRVCNSDSDGDPANYIVQATCGAASQYNSISNTFETPSGASVSPAQIFLDDVQADQCASIGYQNVSRIFVVGITATDVPDDEAFQCAFQLLSADSETPGSVTLDRAVVQCVRSDFVPPGEGDPPYVYYVGDNLVNRTEAFLEAYGYLYEERNNQDNQTDNSKSWWAIFITTLTVGGVLLIVLAVVFVVVAIGAWLVSKERSARIAAQG